MVIDLDQLFDWRKHMVGPEKLTDLCYKVICNNLDIISVKSKRGFRSLRKGLILPSDMCDEIIKCAQQNERIDEDIYFFSMFKNLKATKLKCIKIESSSLSDDSVAIIARHKVAEIDLTNCSNLTRLSIEYINANSDNLKALALRPFVDLKEADFFSKIVFKLSEDSEMSGESEEYPESLSYYGRGYVFNAPHLKRLALERIELPSKEFNILLGGLTQLTHLDLSNSSEIGSFSFKTMLPNLVSLSLYNVRISTYAEVFVSNVTKLKNLR